MHLTSGHKPIYTAFLDSSCLRVATARDCRGLASDSARDLVPWHFHGLGSNMIEPAASGVKSAARGLAGTASAAASSFANGHQNGNGRSNGAPLRNVGQQAAEGLAEAAKNVVPSVQQAAANASTLTSNALDLKLKNPANTNVVLWGGRLLALWEVRVWTKGQMLMGQGILALQYPCI